jgi:hypothetical protein
MEKDRRAILCAPVRALAVQLRGIVIFPENLEQIFVANLGGIELDFHSLGVTGAVGADIFVGRIVHLSAGVADTGGDDARNLAEGGLDSPETACRKRGLRCHDCPSLRLHFCL